MSGAPCAVAVISDASALDRIPSQRSHSIDSVLQRWSALIREQTGEVTWPVCVASANAEALSAGLRALLPRIGSFVVIRTERAHLPAVAHRPVVSDRAMTAVAVTAVLLTALNRRGRSPRGTRVVVAGATTMPTLRPLLAASGFGSVTCWERSDAGMFPLRNLAHDAEVVVDLAGCTRELVAAASGRPELMIITPDPVEWALVALPGLLRAMATAEEPLLDTELHHALALALVAATPPGRALPDPRDPDLILQVQDVAARTLQSAARTMNRRTSWSSSTC